MVRRVDIDDLVDARAVAEILNLKHTNSVSTYAKRYMDFPEPVLNLGRGRTFLWLRPQIVKWARKTGRGEVVEVGFRWLLGTESEVGP